MPKIFSDQNSNLYFYIYTNDHQPAHVHVYKGKKNEANIMKAKINIGTSEKRPHLVQGNTNMTNKDIIAALKIVAKNQEVFLEKWQEIHGR